MSRFLDLARAAHGTLPDWVRVLAEQVDASNQGRVAAAIGYSSSVVSQVLNARYQGNAHRVASAVLGAFCGHTVACPVLGELPAQECLRHQRQSFCATNPIRVRLYRACHSGQCPHAHDQEIQE